MELQEGLQPTLRTDPKKPGQDFVPMINLLLPTTLQPTFRTDPGFS